MEKRKDKSWFLTGSYDAHEKQLKIVFYDQGIGIPNSLPVSKIKEKVLDYFSKNNIGKLEQVKEQVLLKAAMELDRTSTNQNDRGKGLQDLLSFIEERGEGYLSIISSKGLYKCTVSGLKKTVKSTSFDKPLLGTLIIWSTNLNKDT
jgi:hypothetical protein